MHRTSVRGIVATGIALVLGCAALIPATAAAGTPSPSTSEQAAEITRIVKDAMSSIGLKAVIVKVTKGDEVIIRKAWGESMTDVPATPKMRFRNGAVAYQYLGNLLMQLVDEKKVTLDDTIDEWYPDLPNADQVTLKMLANQTSGYPDYQFDPGWRESFGSDPFQIFTVQERLDYAFSQAPFFEPGTNWSYAHTNFLILGEILAKVGGKPLRELVREKVLEPLGLDDTTGTQTSEIPSPVLHTFSSERTGLYEEATFWNTSWGTPPGLNQTTTIDDLATTAAAMGSGKFLSKKSAEAMNGPNLLGFGEPQENCAPSCFTQTEFYNFGLGVIRQGDWLLQTPLLSGIGATDAYLPSEKISIAVAITLLPDAFTAEDNYPPNPSKTLFVEIGKYLAPNHAPPTPPASS